MLLTGPTASCDPAPASLPAPQRSEALATGARVRHGAVHGFLARPRSAAGPLPGVLVLVDTLDETSQGRGLALAEGGAVALVVPDGVETAAAQAYLAAMPATDAARISVQCTRDRCP